MAGPWLALPVLLLALVALSTSEENDGEKSGRIPLWTDVYMRSELDWADADYKLSYLMDTYDIVSVEKCLYHIHNDQNTVSLTTFSPEYMTLREVPELENLHYHFHAFSGWGTSQSPKSVLKAAF